MDKETKVLGFILSGLIVPIAVLSPSHYIRVETLEGMAFQHPVLVSLSLAMMIFMLTGVINACPGAPGTTSEA